MDAANKSVISVKIGAPLLENVLVAILDIFLITDVVLSLVKNQLQNVKNLLKNVSSPLRNGKVLPENGKLLQTNGLFLLRKAGSQKSHLLKFVSSRKAVNPKKAVNQANHKKAVNPARTVSNAKAAKNLSNARVQKKQKKQRRKY